MSHIRIVKAAANDVPVILAFIQELASFEKLSHQVVASEESLLKTLFGKTAFAQVIFLEEEGVKVGFALYFFSYSTFLAKPGLYLEDLFVKPTHRSKGYGRLLMVQLAAIAVTNNCGRFEWSVLDWNTRALDFYKTLGAEPLYDWTVQRISGEKLTALGAKSALTLCT